MLLSVIRNNELSFTRGSGRRRFGIENNENFSFVSTENALQTR